MLMLDFLRSQTLNYPYNIARTHAATNDLLRANKILVH